MIRTFKNKKTDERSIAGQSSPPKSSPPESGEPFDYSNVIVKKPWGYEYLVFENETVAIWMLQIIRKRKTSMHCHPKKKTALILLSGEATCHHLEGEDHIAAMDGIVIEEGVFHSTEAFSSLPIDPLSENGIWVMEIESPPDKDDLVRMQDEYGRAGKSYEGTDNMVFDPADCIKLEEPTSGKFVRQKFHDCAFTVWRGTFPDASDAPQPEALVSVIGRPAGEEGRSALQSGGLMTYEEFCNETRGVNLDAYLFLALEKVPVTMKVSDYVFSRIAELGVTDVFTVSGGAAMHLLDSLGKNPGLNYVATHHEQAAAMAAEGYARVTGKPGVALVTSGPGGTNALTGVCGAWIDSIPSIFLSGQVTSNSLLAGTGLRQFGIQESDIVSMVKSVTKYAVTVTDAEDIRYHLDKAIHLATSGRPGPVWLDLPLDIQSKMVVPDQLREFVAEEEVRTEVSNELKHQVGLFLELLQQAERPVLISGYGIRLAEGEEAFRKVVDALGIPLICSWTSSDLIASDHPLAIGRSGIFGDRAGNFTVQNADLVLSVGSRLSVPQIGYQFHLFARQAKKVMVDIDPAELNKPSLDLDLGIQADAREFLEELLRQLQESPSPDVSPWVKRCQEWKKKYPVVLPEYKDVEGTVNSFYFVDRLSRLLDSDAVVCTDMGTSFTCTMQTFQTKPGQRLFTSSGHASMGFGLPGTIGACVGHQRRDTICISGDGGLQMNIQELQTLVSYQFPIKLFVLNNNGYLTIKATQQNHFGRFVGAEPTSGVSCPDIVKVAEAYGLKAVRIANTQELDVKLETVLSTPGPVVCEVMMPENQLLIPRISSLKKPDGSIVAKPLEDLFPFLDRKEFQENMIIDPVDILK